MEKKIEVAGRTCIFFVPDSGADNWDRLLVIHGDEKMAELMRRERLLPVKTYPAVMVLAKDRLSEYTPWPAKALKSVFPDFGGQADAYLNWMENKLLPVLNEEFQCSLKPEHTGMMGWSLGGLLSLYAQTTPIANHFGVSILVSPSTWYPDFLEHFLTRFDKEIAKRWVLIYGNREAEGHKDIKENTVTNNRAIAAVLRAYHGDAAVQEHWDAGGHHENMVSRFRLALELF